VDVTIAPELFDGLLQELAGQTQPPREPVIELVANSQSTRGMLASMRPWLLTMAILTVCGVTLGPLLGETASGRCPSSSRSPW
jgi:hypothetical protein